jgi:hypothetical protein
MKKIDDKLDNLLEEIRSLPEPDYSEHFNIEKQEEVHQNLIQFARNHESKKKSSQIVQRVSMGIAGMTVVMLGLFLALSMNGGNNYFSIMLSQSAHNTDLDLESFFRDSLEEVGREPDSYSIIHKKMNINSKGDALIIFTEKIENELEVHLAYFSKEHFPFTEHNWMWRTSRGATWSDDVNWKMVEDIPYLYFGAISNNSIADVFVGDQKATIITVEGDKRFWYAKIDQKDVPVKYRMDNGDERVVESNLSR